MASNLIISVLSIGTKLLRSITASAQVLSSSSSNAADEDLESLMRTLERIKATLYDAENREIRDCSVKHWLKELKQVAYDAEDVLSEYRYEATRVQVEARQAFQAFGFYKKKHMEDIVPISDAMVDRLNKIRSRFYEISMDREALQLREIDGLRRPNKKILRPPTGHMIDEASIFGRDVEITAIINFILSEKEKPFSVISVVGKGGLGKTTIAQLVYKDQRVSQYFDLFGWVCVSEEFDVRRLTKATIESISSGINYGFSHELSPLQEQLARSVMGKSILLVLDDVWNENQSLWELFLVPIKGAKMVRILVTTRNIKVAEVMQTTTYFKPTNLPEDSCWQLFQHYAFSGTSHTMPPHLVEIMGREIMRKCGGLPLAVKSIASLLGHETNEEVWKEILESDLWETNESREVIFPALEISYAHLPAHLKSCFLFCSMYPKNYLLEKRNLIELWMSHGYIQSAGKKKITEIGVAYYKELKERSFLDDISGQSSECCKLHDIIHDLARLKSENEHYSVEINHPFDIKEENVPRDLYHLYASGFMGYVNQILEQNLKGLRTLSVDLRMYNGDLEHDYCINNQKAMDLNSKLSECYEYATDFMGIVNQVLRETDLKGLRTLSAYLRKRHGDLEHEICSKNTLEMDLNIKLIRYLECSVVICNLSKFEALRALELKGYSLRKLPCSISKLKHLAYLGITSSRLKLLPFSIGLLYNLQTLILDCLFLEYLPESIGNLSNLQFLYIQSSKIKKLPKSICSLCNLLRLVIKSDNLEGVPLDIRNLCDLLGLTIRSNRILALPNTIGCLSSLEELNLLPLRGSDVGDDELPNTTGCSSCFASEYWLHYVPHHGLVNFTAIKKMSAWLRVRTVAWLKDMNDLGGKLSIEGLENMSNLEDVRHANLRNKCKLETLELLWCHDVCYLGGVCYQKLELKLQCLRPEFSEGRLVRADNVDYFLLECLQPHPHLKKLRVYGYQSATVPRWMGDPSSLQSIEKVTLEHCVNIQSLPFSNLHTMKHLTIDECHSIRVLQMEKVSSQLEELHILSCDCLELITGLGNLPALKHLTIDGCHSIRFLQLEQLSSRLEELNILKSDGLELSTILRNLNTLKHLTIKECSSNRVLQLEQHSSQLEELHILNCDCLELITGLGNLPTLKHLTIKKCHSIHFLQLSSRLEELNILKCDCLELSTELGNLPTLKHLTIKKCHSIRVLQLEPLFSQLEELNIVKCDWLELITGLENLPTLKCLTIKKCYSIRVLQIEQLSSQLEELNISKCNCLELTTALGNLYTLKYLYIDECHSIRVLQLEQLSSCKDLYISDCDCLELITGLGNLDNLDRLEISSCKALKSITMEELQLLESIDPFDDSSDHEENFGQKRISWLTSLIIKNCDLLRDLPDGLILSLIDYVCVEGCGCPDIKF